MGNIFQGVVRFLSRHVSCETGGSNKTYEMLTTLPKNICWGFHWNLPRLLAHVKHCEKKPLTPQMKSLNARVESHPHPPQLILPPREWNTSGCLTASAQGLGSTGDPGGGGPHTGGGKATFTHSHCEAVFCFGGHSVLCRWHLEGAADGLLFWSRVDICIYLFGIQNDTQMRQIIIKTQLIAA